MNQEDLYRILLGQICSGMIASGRKDDNEILEEAKSWAKVIIKEEYYDNKFERLYTGFNDAKGRQILDGDIFIYDEWKFKETGIPNDLISNFEKYKDFICLHPVFWDKDKNTWCSDVYRDADNMRRYDFDRLYVVSNKIEHPELYNH